MKLLFALVPYIVLVTGCATHDPKPATYVNDVQALHANYERLRQCVVDQLDLYNDLCAEESPESGTDTGSDTAPDAHFFGVKCAVESIQECAK